MPNRLLREGFVDSESVAALSDWTHRVYSNLIVKVDDAGRYDARIEFIRSTLFPLGTTRRAEDFRKALEEMSHPTSNTGEPLPALLENYEYAGKPFLQLMKVARCGKSTVSKYPWKDGSFDFVYVKRPTRDGAKEFVATSIIDGVATPCVPHATPSDRCLDSPAETGTGAKAETDVGGVGKPNEIETAFVRRLFDEVKWLVASQINPQKRDRLISLMAASGEEVSREILESAPSKCDKTGIDVWLAWSMSTLANKLAESKPKPKPIATRAPIRPSPNRRAS